VEQIQASLEEQKRKTKKTGENLELSTARCSELQQQCLTAERELKDRVSVFASFVCVGFLVLDDSVVTALEVMSSMLPRVLVAQ